MLRPRIDFRQLCAGLALVVMMLAAAPTSHAQEEGPPPALVRVGKVAQESLQERVAVIGRLRETRRSFVAAEQSGKLMEVPIENGSVVDTQTVLARIEPIWVEIDIDEAKANLIEAQAEVEQLQAEVDQARLEADRLTELQRDKAARPREVEMADADLKGKQGELAATKARVLARDAELARAQQQLERLVVRSPFDGVIVRKLVEVGQWVTPGTTVAEVVSRGEIDVMIDVPERLINSITPGDTLVVGVDALGQDIEARIDAIIPAADNAARTFPVRLRTTDDNGRLKTGMSVTAWVPTGDPGTRLTVPRDAIVRTPTGAQVWANLGGKAMPVAVEVLFGVGDRYAIELLDPTGIPLAEGMEVVIEGAERLFPTRPLDVTTQPQVSAKK